jgi:hypothetical protein
MAKVLYMSCSAYSGSTLLSFLLNTHPEVVTVGHTMGWNFGPEEEFRCSCGSLLQECGFFRQIGRDFEEAGLPFDFRNFGTAYRVAGGERLNRWLTANLPLINSSAPERVRDRLLLALPGIGARLRQQDQANLVFFRSAVKQRGASVFVDNSHDPHRLRHLARVPELKLMCAHLVRDPRGVTLSNMTKKGWDPRLSTRRWLRHQSTIARVAGHYSEMIRIYYEDLCEDVDKTLETLYGFVGLPVVRFSGDFKLGEHHILGNVMRLRDGKVSRDTRWKRELPAAEQRIVIDTARSWLNRHRNDPAAEIVEHYLEAEA